MEKIILASASPRRKELLEQIGVQFTIRTSDKEEEHLSGEPQEAAMRQAQIKARDVADCTEEGVVIGADTVVALDGRILGKPRDEDDAREMLRSLSGRTHEVYTGVSVVIKRAGEITEELSFYERTGVGIASMTQEQIDAYIRTKEPMDKAGAYAIQGRFAVYVNRLEGDYYNVVGLPVNRLYETLCKRGVCLLTQNY